jgi:hypothetical protein
MKEGARNMTYLDAVSIKQDFIVSMQFADILGKTRIEAYTETAKKYTAKELSDAFIALEENIEKERETIRALFLLAIKSKEGA